MDDDGDIEESLARTGHDVHFLSRLSRVTLDQTELALGLYRDPTLVRDLLADGACPQGGERIAVPLAAPPDPPHIILARDGAFVTCLGAGMLPDGTPALPWERIAIHVERARVRAERTAAADEVIKGGRAERLLLRLVFAGELNREEFVELAAIAPVLRPKLVEQLLQNFPVLIKVGRALPRSRSRHDTRKLKLFWHLCSSTGHLLLLSFLDGRSGFEWWMSPEVRAKADIIRYLLDLVRCNYPPLSLRLLWTLGRGGKLALPTLKRALAEAETFGDWFYPALGLLNVALQHQRLRAEAAAAVSAKLPAAMRAEASHVRFAGTVRKYIDRFADAEPDQKEGLARSYAVQAIDLITGSTVATNEEAIRGDALWPTRATHLVYDPSRKFREGVGALLATSSALADQPAERFYFPAAAIAEAPRFSPERALDIARCIAPLPPPPHRAPERTGRNDPCPCGSGKKHKKCCGAAA